MAALNTCSDPDSHLPSLEDLGEHAEDYQMHYLVSQLAKKVHLINDAPDENARQAQLAIQTYEIANEFLNKVVNTDFGTSNSKLIILGGVQINMPVPMPDYFMPIRYEIHQKGKQTLDLLGPAFTDAK